VEAYTIVGLEKMHTAPFSQITQGTNCDAMPLLFLLMLRNNREGAKQLRF